MNLPIILLKRMTCIGFLLIFFYFSSMTQAVERVALVIGNSDYETGGGLENPVNDAFDMLEALSALKFEVICRINADEREMEYAIERFGKKIETNNEIAFFYYAGHAMQIQERNYLIPVRSKIKNEIDVKTDAVDVEKVLARMNGADNALNVVVLDACRDNPFKVSSRAFRKGLAQMEARAGTILCYATAPGQVAADGGMKLNDNLRNSVYTSHLLKHIRNPELSITEVFDKTGLDVVEKTNGEQTPVVLKYPIKKIYLAQTTPTAVPLRISDPKAMLDVNTFPEKATIYLNDQYVGISPIEISGLEPGGYELKVVSKGFFTENRKVHLTELEKAFISFYLVEERPQPDIPPLSRIKSGTQQPVPKIQEPKEKKPIPEQKSQAKIEKKVKIRISPTPSNARIALVSPKKKYTDYMPLSPGKYQVHVSQKGYKSQTVWITIQETDSDLKDISVHLKAFKAGEVISDSLTGLPMVWIPPGCFDMGCNAGAPDCGVDATPKHTVCLDGFWMAKFETTQKAWSQIMGYNGSKVNRGNKYPVESVSFQEVDTFIRRLNIKSSNKYRLPTEAEWEYAATSMGKDRRYPGGDNPEEIGWFERNSREKTQAVGEKMPNGMGIHDMGGNVWEWCADDYVKNAYTLHDKKNPVIRTQSKDKVVRGGGWYGPKEEMLATNRRFSHMHKQNYDIGFRLVRE